MPFVAVGLSLRDTVVIDPQLMYLSAWSPQICVIVDPLASLLSVYMCVSQQVLTAVMFASVRRTFPNSTVSHAVQS